MRNFAFRPLKGPGLEPLPWPTWAARRMSSYDEFVHEPMSALVICVGHAVSLAHLGRRCFADGSAPRSGECGPTTCRLQRVEVESRPARRRTPPDCRRPSGSATRCSRNCPRRGAARSGAVGGAEVGGHARVRTGRIEVVAPSSAPMLQMVALPVAADRLRAPGRKYSRILLVPPFHGQQRAEIGDDVPWLPSSRRACR